MDAILIVAHGNQSRDNSNTESISKVVETLTGLPVRCAYRRYSDIRVRVAMESLAKSGARSVLIIPFFISENMYSRSIPRSMGLREGGAEGVYTAECADVRYRTTSVVGDHPLAVGILGDIAEGSGSNGVLLVSKCSDKGTVDPLVSAGLEEIRSRGMYAEWCANTKDPIPAQDAIQRMHAAGASDVIVIPVSIGASVRFVMDGLRQTAPFGHDSRMAKLIADIVLDELAKECD